MITPNNLKTGAIKIENLITLIITTSDDQFIGRVEMRELDNTEVLEVFSATARPTFGNLLYQSAAKYAFNEKKSITSSRDGATRGAALSIWERFYKTFNPLNIQVLPEHLNIEVMDGLEEDEYKPFIHSYFMPSSKAFNVTFVDLNKDNTSESAQGLLKALEESKEHFYTSYELDGNKWIDEDFPLAEIYTTTYPLKISLPINNILIDYDTFKAVERDIAQGQGSRTDGPIQCVVDIDGDIVFIDGHHRYIEAINNGKTEIEVVIEHNEYIQGFTHDVDRPNKNKIISVEKIKAFTADESSMTF